MNFTTTKENKKLTKNILFLINHQPLCDKYPSLAYITNKNDISSSKQKKYKKKFNDPEDHSENRWLLSIFLAIQKRKKSVSLAKI